MGKPQFEEIEAKAGDWVEGVVTRPITIVRPAKHSDGGLLATVEQCRLYVVQRVRRRSRRARKRLTDRKREG